MENLNNYTEEICIVAITSITIASMFLMGSDASNIVSALGGGLLGYLTKSRLSK